MLTDDTKKRFGGYIVAEPASMASLFSVVKSSHDRAVKYLHILMIDPNNADFCPSSPL